MKYKTVMLDLATYSRLAEAKSKLKQKMDVNLSFNEFFLELISNRLDLLDVDEKLKDYVANFADGLRELDHVLGAILFGSVAKGTHTQYSDIDILVLTEGGERNLFDEIMVVADGLKEYGITLMERGLPSLISPLILGIDETSILRPIFFDIVDYGIILFEKQGSVSSFRSSIKKIRHRREKINDMEVLTWK